MSDVQFHTYNGVETFISANGEFYAHVGGVYVNHSTFNGLKKIIEAEKKADAKAVKVSLPCFVVFTTGDGDNEQVKVIPAKLTGINRNDSTLKWDVSIDGKILFAVPDTEENFKLALDYAAARNTKTRLSDQLRKRRLRDSIYGGRIQASEYATAIERLQNRYDSALAGKGIE